MAEPTAVSSSSRTKPNLSIKAKENVIISIKNLNLRNEKAKVLLINNYKDVEEIKAKLVDLSKERFPQIFLIVIECNKSEFDNDFMTFLSEKFTDYKSIYLQIISSKKSKFFNKEGEFFEIFMNKTKSRKRKMKTKNFLQVVGNLKISFVHVDLIEVLNVKNIDEVLEIFEKTIRAKDEDLTKILLLFIASLNEKIIDAAIQSKDLKFLLVLLEHFEAFQVETFMIRLVQRNEIKTFKILSESSESFTRLVRLSLWSEMRKISHENNFYEFNFEIQKLESEPKYISVLFDEEEKLRHKNQQTFPKILKNFHKNIVEGNLEKVKEFVEKFPDFKICCDENEVCALLNAIEAKQFEIFSFLRSEGFLASNEEELKSSINRLDSKDKLKIKDGTKNFSKPNPNNFINTLCNKCDIFSYSGSIKHEENREMLLKLSTDEDLKFLLIFTSDTEVKIIFDFKTESVSNMDPTCDERTMGLAYFSQNLLYVGKDENYLKRYGTFTHEMSHLMFYLLFDNMCLPYCEGDTLRENKWKEIVKNEKEKFEQKTKEERDLMEPIIRWVFEYYKADDPEEEIYLQSVELAVRVNHISGRYIEEKNKVQELEKEHPDIFSFYRENVLPFLKVPHAYKIIKLNENFEVLESVKESHLQVELRSENNLMNRLKNQPNKIILSSNVPQLTLSQITQKILTSSKNHVEIKVNYLFVDLEMLKDGTNEKDLKFLIENSELKKIFVKAQNFNEKSLENLKLLKLNERQKLICIIDQKNTQKFKEKFNFQILTKTYAFNDLTEKSKEQLLNQKITFQGSNIKVKDLIDFSHFSQEFFNSICFNQNLQINNQKLDEKYEVYFPRKINKKAKVISNQKGNNFNENIINVRHQNIHEVKTFFENIESIGDEKSEVKFEFREKSLEDFIKEVEDEKIVLISDQAGSGKTTVLHKINEQLKKDNSKLWISFVGLKDHIEELSKGVGESFQDFLVTILNFDALEAQIFQEKFSKSKVRILFDAFDEISPRCKEETLKLFKLFLIQNGYLKNQIWVTTRTHLEHDLENELKVLAHKLKNLNENEQIKFLAILWKESKDDQDFIKKCAEYLVKKISEMIKDNPSLIGLPLIVEGLGRFYKDKINEKFPQEIETLSISLVYEKIIVKGNLKILRLKFPEKYQEVMEKSESIFKVYFYFAIKQFFGEEFAEQLGLIWDPDEWSPEEISRGGITNYDKDGNLKFNHETYAEFLIIKFLFGILKDFKFPNEFQIKLFDEVLSEEKFQISRMFLNDMLEHVEVEKLKFFSSNKFENYLEKVQTSTISFSAREGLFGICEIFFKKLKSKNIQNYKNFLLTRDEKLKKTISMEILPKIKNFRKFSSFSSEILELFGENVFEEFLMLEDGEGNTILHHITNENVDWNILKAFREKFFKNLSKEKIHKIFFHNNKEHQNFLLFPFNCLSKTDEKVLKIFWLIEENLTKDEQKEILKSKGKFKELVLHRVVSHSIDFLQKVFEFYEYIFNTEEFRELILEHNEDGNNILHVSAVSVMSKEIFEFLWLKISEVFESPKELFMQKGQFDRNILQMSSHNDDSEIFSFTFSLAESFSETEEEVKSLILKKNSENNNLLSLTVMFAPISNLKFLFKKLFEIFKENEVKNLLRTSKGFEERNLLSLATQSEHFDSIEFLWETFEANLSREEIFGLLNEKDKKGNNFLYLAAFYAKSKEIIEILWLKVVKHFYNEKIIKNYLKLKGFDERNILEISICRTKENSFFYIFENIFCKFFTFKDFIYECNGEFLHFLAYFGSALMLEFSFKKLEEYLKIEELKKFLRSKSTKHRRNLLHCAAISNSDENSVKFIFEKIEMFLSREEILRLINEKDEEGNNFLHHAAHSAKSREIFEFLWLKVVKHFDNEEILKNYVKLKGSCGRNLLLASISSANENSFFYIFENIFCKFFNFNDFIYECDNNGESFLHSLFHFSSVSMLKVSFKKIEENLEIEELKKFLNSKSTKDQNNLLHCAAFSTLNKFENSINFFVEMIEIYLSQEEIVRLLNDKNERGENFLHEAAHSAKSKEVFEFLWLKVKKLFNDEEKLKNYVKSKGLCGRDILQASISSTNEKSFLYIFENIFCKFFILEDFIYECDEVLGENFLHKLVRYGSVQMIEFSFQKLEKKFKIQEIQYFIKTKSQKYRYNLLHCAALQNLNENSIILIFEKIKMYLCKSVVKEFLIDRDLNNYFPLHSLIEFNTPEVFTLFTSLYEEHFTKAEIKEILSLKNWIVLANRNKIAKNMKEIIEKYVIQKSN